jgi:hypothetical protein
MEAEDVKEQLERWRCRLAEGTRLRARDELQNVSAILVGAETIPAVLFQRDAELRPVLSPMKRARSVEAVLRALE